MDGHLVDWAIREFYEEKYGVANHSGNDPISIIKFNPSENFFKFGKRATLMRRFLNDPAIAEKTRMSLVEFMALPRHMTEAIFEFVEESKLLEKEQLEAQAAQAAKKEGHK